jgi:hypothetical protein
MDAKKIAELKRSNAGWLTPDDELIACSLYNHIPELRAAGFRPDLFEAYDEAMENRAEEERDFIERYGDDEHIPWHCYGDGDTTHERTLETIVTAATIQGWIRIGIMIDIDAVKADISSCGGHSEWRKVRAKTPMVMRIDSRRGIPAAIKDIADPDRCRETEASL